MQVGADALHITAQPLCFGTTTLKLATIAVGIAAMAVRVSLGELELTITKPQLCFQFS